MVHPTAVGFYSAAWPRAPRASEARRSRGSRAWRACRWRQPRCGLPGPLRLSYDPQPWALTISTVHVDTIYTHCMPCAICKVRARKSKLQPKREEEGKGPNQGPILPILRTSNLRVWVALWGSWGLLGSGELGDFELSYSRSQKLTVWPSSDPETKERRRTSINHPTSIFQLFRVCYMCETCQGHLPGHEDIWTQGEDMPWAARKAVPKPHFRKVMLHVPSKTMDPTKSLLELYRVVHFLSTLWETCFRS